MENRLTADKFEQIEFPGGIFYRANHKRFPALRGLAVQKLKLKPGASREPHSHPKCRTTRLLYLGESKSWNYRSGGSSAALGTEGRRHFLCAERLRPLD